MRELISEYGRSLLAAIATISILALVLGLLSMSGRLLTEVYASEGTNPGQISGEAMKKSMEDGLSQIGMEHSIRVWESYDLEELMHYGGSGVSELHVIEVRDINGEDVTAVTRCGRSRLRFEKEGVYCVMASFTDAEQVTSIRKIYLGVGQQ